MYGGGGLTVVPEFWGKQKDVLEIGEEGEKGFMDLKFI